MAAVAVPAVGRIGSLRLFLVVGIVVAAAALAAAAVNGHSGKGQSFWRASCAFACECRRRRCTLGWRYR